MGWWRIGCGCLVLPFPPVSNVSCAKGTSRRASIVSRAVFISHPTMFYATTRSTRYTICTTKGANMRTTPHILYIIYKNGQKVRLNLGAQTPAERRVKLNDWAKTVGTKTAFLAWK